MSKKIALLRLLVITILIIGTPALLCSIWLFTDYGCFSTLFPSAKHLTRITNIRFPPSTTNLEWRCQRYLDANKFIFRFKISSRDVQTLVTASNANSLNLRDASYLFELFDDPLAVEQSSATYTVWQTNYRCGWTNFLIAMDDPAVYTVYADYNGWEHCFAEYW